MEVYLRGTILPFYIHYYVIIYYKTRVLTSTVVKSHNNKTVIMVEYRKIKQCSGIVGGWPADKNTINIITNIIVSSLLCTGLDKNSPDLHL